MSMFARRRRVCGALFFALSCAPLCVLAAPLATALAAPPAVAAPGASEAPATRQAALQARLEALAARARPGTLGVAVLDLQNGAQWDVNGARAYPMMSDFKAPVAAAVLARVDAGTLSLGQAVTLTRADLVPGSAVPSIGERFRGPRMRVTVAELLEAAVSQSDNTAVDALLRLLGGPQAMTQFLRENGIADMTVRADERAIGRVFANLAGASAAPAGEAASQRSMRLDGGYRAFLAAPPNATTPAASALFMRKLWQGQLLSASSTRHLLDLMFAQSVPARMRAGLPDGYRLADKTGTSVTVAGRIAAFNDTGILVAPDGRAVVVTLYLTASPMAPEARDALFAELARTVCEVLLPAR